uniref:Uncharacterized protein n=1 Tax=Eutreptiella gymnastica TaxID=73025 RepID=A0A7S4GHC9_9EUGL
MEWLKRNVLLLCIEGVAYSIPLHGNRVRVPQTDSQTRSTQGVPDRQQADQQQCKTVVPCSCPPSSFTQTYPRNPFDLHSLALPLSDWILEERQMQRPDEVLHPMLCCSI